MKNFLKYGGHYIDSVSEEALGQLLRIDSISSNINLSQDTNSISIDSVTIDALIEWNNQITIQNSIEDYWVQVNLVFFNTIANQNYLLSDEERTVLIGIANSCSDYYGESVLRARIILNLVDSIYNTFSDNCDEFDFKIENGTGPILSIYPNPTENSVIVLFNALPESGSTLKIYDLLGNIVQRFELSNTTNYKYLDLSDLLGGIYFIALSLNNHDDSVTKIILTK